MNGDEAADLAAVLKALDHVRQRRVGQPVAVIGEKDLFVLQRDASRPQALANVAPDSGVDERDAPVRRPFTQNFDLLAEIRNDAVVVRRLLVVQKIILDDIGLVAKAKDEILMTILAIVLHDMPQDRLVSDRHHRLWNVLRVFANARAKPAAEQHNFHDASSRGSITSTLGIGTMNLQPQSPTWRICAMISFFRFQGKMSR